MLADPNYINSIEVTVVFCLATAFIALALGLLLAVMADQVVRGRGFYRTLLIWPYAVAPAIAGMLWLFIFNPSIGHLRLSAAPCRHRLGPAAQRHPCHDAGGGGRGVEADQLQLPVLRRRPAGDPEIASIEAAAIDGASAWRRFRSIIFPLLAPTTFFLLVINTVYAFFDTFGIIHAVTSGGPGKATETLVYKVYNDGFVNLQLGISSAESVILMAIVIALTAVQFRYIEQRVHYA